MLSKPQPCEQDWSNMTLVCGGRICGKCRKLITDFTKMDWDEIEQMQSDNHNALCGIYTDKQLKYWGKQPPPNRITRATNAAAFISTLLTSPLVGQPIDHRDTIPKTNLYGTITGYNKDGSIDTLIGSSIHIENTDYGTATDNHGRYELDITKFLHSDNQLKVIFSYTGYGSAILTLGAQKGQIEFNAELLETNFIGPTIFYVRQPTFGQKIKELFRRKKKKD